MINRYICLWLELSTISIWVQRIDFSLTRLKVLKKKVWDCSKWYPSDSSNIKHVSTDLNEGVINVAGQPSNNFFIFIYCAPCSCCCCSWASLDALIDPVNEFIILFLFKCYHEKFQKHLLLLNLKSCTGSLRIHCTFYGAVRGGWWCS